MNENIITHRLDTHERRINNYSIRLDKLEQDGVKRDIQIENVCKSIEGLISTIKVSLVTITTSLIGFFFYAIQNNLF